MANERLGRLEQKANGVEQWIWKTISAIGLALIVWYLNGINISLKTLSDDIIAIKLSDSANAVRMNKIEEEVITLKASDKEIRQRVSALEREK
ncbi:hypothetical protein B9T19_03645 [Ignatzschineria sp. F8392]|uniref:hypothetical protein n=1 Tax=Ignatzschineria sp. F8392 TaxID=1980117 RepID=UPI000B99726E|nr:hypothetical protein [Ignatzschineria sp. F8392]OYQ81767.1 hypothetical protein B9T19_03645 [Ignatzschineria sp. F8392]